MAFPPKSFQNVYFRSRITILRLYLESSREFEAFDACGDFEGCRAYIAQSL